MLEHLVSGRVWEAIPQLFRNRHSTISSPRHRAIFMKRPHSIQHQSPRPCVPCTPSYRPAQPGLQVPHSLFLNQYMVPSYLRYSHNNSSHPSHLVPPYVPSHPFNIFLKTPINVPFSNAAATLSLSPNCLFTWSAVLCVPSLILTSTLKRGGRAFSSRTRTPRPMTVAREQCVIVGVR